MNNSDSRSFEVFPSGIHDWLYDAYIIEYINEEKEVVDGSEWLTKEEVFTFLQERLNVSFYEIENAFDFK